MELSELRALAEKAKAEFDALLAADFSPPGAHADNHFKMHDLVLALPALLDERDRLAARVERLEAALTTIRDTRKGYVLGGCDTDEQLLAGYSRIVTTIWNAADAAFAAAKKED